MKALCILALALLGFVLTSCTANQGSSGGNTEGAFVGSDPVTPVQRTTDFQSALSGATRSTVR